MMSDRPQSAAPQAPSPVKQPWWLPNPGVKGLQPWWLTPSAPYQPEGLGLFVGGFALMLFFLPPLLLVVTVANLVLTGRVGMDNSDPELAVTQLLNPVGTYTLLGVAGLLSMQCGWLLWRGRRRRDLRLAVILLWLILPGLQTSQALLHWYTLWRNNIVIYDTWLRLGDILPAVIMTVLFSLYLLRSPRLKRRFPETMADPVDVF